MVSQESAENFTLRDNSGRPYSLLFCRSGECWAFWVRDKGAPVGDAQCMGMGETLSMGDIHIRDDVRPGWPKCLRFVSWFGLQRWPKDYRGRGIGTALLRFVIESARQSGFKRIEGNLKPLDLGNNPRLPDWYRRHGFEVQMEPDLRAGKVWLELGCTD